MSVLLVSVRDALEAEAALRGGAAVIDVKEPRRGSLGRAPRETREAVARHVDGRVPLSVAWGELLEHSPVDVVELPANTRYAKCGLAGCRTVPDWPDRWRTWIRQLPPSVQPVAVAYADWPRCGAPEPARVLAHGTELGCRIMLWDTHQKDGSHLFDHVDCRTLAELVREARARGLRIALAGSLTVVHLPALMRFNPDFVAVRGAVCGGDRLHGVRERRVAQFAEALAACPLPG